MYKSSDDKEIVELYEQILHEMDVTGDVYGGTEGAITLTNTGNYGNPEDSRNVFGMGLMTRRGKIKPNKKSIFGGVTKKSRKKRRKSSK